MARALLTAIALGACSPALEPGFFRCDATRGCPDDWHCHRDGFCYPERESFADGGGRDAGAREDGALPDGAPSDAGPPDARDGSHDAGCDGPEDCDDSIECTDDLCTGGVCRWVPAPGRCFIEGVCYDAGARRADNDCFVCVGGETTWSIRVSEPCEASACHTGEVCMPDGTCAGMRLADGTICESGPATSICCDGICRATLDDPAHCGACYTACRLDARCALGYCACEALGASTCPADTWVCLDRECRCTGDADCRGFLGQRCGLATGRCIF